MAEPFDAATYLEDVSAIIQQKYFTEFTEEWGSRFGKVSNQLYSFGSEAIGGDGKTMQVELAPADTVRASTNMLATNSNPDSFEAGTLKVRFNKTSASLNDFTQLNASAQVDDVDVRLQGQGSIVDFVERIYNQVVPNYDEHMAVLNNLPRTALIGTVAATPTKNDNITIGSASATASKSAGMRFYTTDASPAIFKRGTRLDFVNASTGAVYAGNVRVTDVNPGDPTGPSVGVEFISSGITARQSTGDVANVVSGAKIYFSGEANAGLYGVGAWFSRPAATGDSFLGGVDRMASGYRWMVPKATREGSSSATITASMFDDQAIAMGYVIEPGQNGMVFVTDPKMHQKLRNEIFQSVIIQQPLDDSTKERFANFGSVGLNYQHGHFGTVKILSDPLCPPNTIRILDPKTWKMLYYGFNGLQPVAGERGNWYRMNENTPNTGRSLIWKADWYAIQAGWCSKPWKNGVILNVTAT